MLKGKKFDVLSMGVTTLDCYLEGKVRIPSLYKYVTRPEAARGMVDPFTNIRPCHIHPNNVMASIRSSNALR